MRHTHSFTTDKLEPRQLLASNVALGVIQMFNITNPDGSRANGQDIVFNFTEPVTIGSTPLTSFGIRGNGINPLSGRQKKFVVPVVAVTQQGVNPNQIKVTTGTLNRTNGRIFIYAGAVKDTRGEDVILDDSSPTTRTIPRGENKERFTLAQRSFSPFDFTFFSNARYPTGGVAAQTLNTQPSTNDVRTSLDSFLQSKVTQGKITSTVKTNTMARFDNAGTIAIIPDQNLRAGLLSLVGTVAEPAIEHYLGTANATGRAATVVAFDGSQFSSNARIAETTKNTAGRFKTIFNPAYSGEPFQVLGSMLAHESTHVSTDSINSQDEEVIANMIEIMVHAQQVDTEAGFARTPSVLVTRQNYRLLLLLNSGKLQFPRVGVAQTALKSGSQGAAPGSFPEFGSNPVASFEADIRAEMSGRNVADKPPTNGNVTTWAILRNITGQTYDPTAPASQFGDALIANVDRFQGVIGDRAAINIAGKLKLII
jgi:hypothetical protein